MCWRSRRLIVRCVHVLDQAGYIGPSTAQAKGERKRVNAVSRRFQNENKSEFS